MHGVRVPVWQTQSAGPVRTAHMSVLLTVNIVSHNPARSSLIFPHNLQTIIKTSILDMVAYVAWHHDDDDDDDDDDDNSDVV